jgi:hypothetical protein
MPTPLGLDQDVRAMPGEYLLAQALFARLISDVRHPRPRRVLHASAGATTVRHQLAAVEALGGDAVEEWADLLNLDSSCLRTHLLREAGLIDPVPHRTP